MSRSCLMKKAFIMEGKLFLLRPQFLDLNRKTISPRSIVLATRLDIVCDERADILKSSLKISMVNWSFFAAICGYAKPRQTRRLLQAIF